MISPTDVKHFEIPALDDEINRVRMAYAFLTSPNFFHQEIAIINPNPQQYDREYLFPRDLYLLSYHVESNEEMPSLRDVVDVLHHAQTACICIGSHKPELDRTIQILCLSKSMNPEDAIPGRVLLTIQFLVKISKSEKGEIINKLLDAYRLLK